MLPVPVRLTTAEGLVEESLVIVTAPVCIPVWAGWKFTFRLRVPPEVRVTGSALPPSRE